MLNPSPVILSRTVTVQDLFNKPIDLTLDLTDDDAPLITGFAIQRYSTRDFVSVHPYIKIVGTQDSTQRSLPAYISTDSPPQYLGTLGLD